MKQLCTLSTLAHEWEDVVLNLASATNCLYDFKKFWSLYVLSLCLFFK
jgi:hypothetical protein